MSNKTLYRFLVDKDLAFDKLCYFTESDSPEIETEALSGYS